MLSYDFAKMNIREINEQNRFLSLREFFLHVLNSFFYALNAKTNSLQFLEFLFFKEVFFITKALNGLVRFDGILSICAGFV